MDTDGTGGSAASSGVSGAGGSSTGGASGSSSGGSSVGGSSGSAGSVAGGASGSSGSGPAGNGGVAAQAGTGQGGGSGFGGSTGDGFTDCATVCKKLLPSLCPGENSGDCFNGCQDTLDGSACAVAISQAMACLLDTQPTPMFCDDSGHARLICGPCDAAAKAVAQSCVSQEIDCSFR